MAMTMALLVGMGWLVSPARVRRWRALGRGSAQRRRRRAAATEVPLVCNRIARRLVVGEHLAVAMEESAAGTALAADLARVVDEHRRGLPLGRAADRWAERDGGFEAGLLAAAVGLGSSVIGARPELFDGVAVALRRRSDLRAEALAQAGQARLSTWVVAALPWVVAVGVVLGGGAPAHILLAEPLGWLCIGWAVALEALGVLWMRRLIGRAVR